MRIVAAAVHASHAQSADGASGVTSAVSGSGHTFIGPENSVPPYTERRRTPAATRRSPTLCASGPPPKVYAGVSGEGA